MKTKPKVKSPFFVVEEFISPLLCEDLVDECGFIFPDMDQENRAIKTTASPEDAQSILFDRLLQIVPQLEEHYGVKYKGMEEIKFEWFPQDSSGAPQCENSEFLKGKWVKVRARDLTCILFLSDYQDKLPFDGEFEVYGGKLEFPQHQFSFVPNRGTLIVFPSVPHFINSVSRVAAGDLYQARIQMVTEEQLIYQPSDYPGNFKTWF